MTLNQWRDLQKLIGRGESAGTEAARLHLVEGLSITEAAKRAGCSPQTASNAVVRRRESIDLCRSVAGVTPKTSAFESLGPT